MRSHRSLLKVYFGLAAARSGPGGCGVCLCWVSGAGSVVPILMRQVSIEIYERAYTIKHSAQPRGMGNIRWRVDSYLVATHV